MSAATSNRTNYKCMLTFTCLIHRYFTITELIDFIKLAIKKIYIDYTDRFLQHQTVRFTLSLRQALKIVLKFFVTWYWVTDFSQVALVRAFVTVGYDALSSYTEINTIFGAPCTYMWSWPLQSLSQLVRSFFCLHLQSERRPMCKPSS